MYNIIYDSLGKLFWIFSKKSKQSISLNQHKIIFVFIYLKFFFMDILELFKIIWLNFV